VRKNVWLLVTTVVVIVGTLFGTLLSGNGLILGLDLQGGISVVLAPVGEVKSQDSLNKAVDIIRRRVDGLGVAEPEISRQGSNVIIDLPGVQDRDKARRVVGKTAELRFRPVLGLVAPDTSTSTTTATNGTTTTLAPGASTTTPTTDANHIPSSTPEQDQANATVVLPGREAKGPRYRLGPAALVGKDVSTARAEYQPSQGWGVDLSLKDSGLQKFNALAAKSFGQPSPMNQVAIVLDGVVQSSPQFQQASYDSNHVSITGNFSETEAKDLATVLKYGALPVQLKEQTTQSVSPTLGQDQLTAGIAAGIIGLALVALYMLAFYRLLGLVVILGLGLSGAATYTIMVFLGAQLGLTLTLAGVTGLILSVGVTVDSYVVYFERLKDEVRTGRTVRSSVDRGFAKSFRTILAADLVSLIGALILYWLAIGSVRQFAFLLGVSTLLDLILSYTFMHPLVYLMSRRRALISAPGVGIAAGLDHSGLEA